MYKYLNLLIVLTEIKKIRFMTMVLILSLNFPKKK